MTAPTPYEFQASLHDSKPAMLDHIAEAYMTASGLNSPDAIRRAFDEADDLTLAAECIHAYELDQAPDHAPDHEPAPQSHMQQADYSAADLAKAFGRLRAQYAAGSAPDAADPAPHGGGNTPQGAMPS